MLSYFTETEKEAVKNITELLNFCPAEFERRAPRYRENVSTLMALVNRFDYVHSAFSDKTKEPFPILDALHKFHN